MTRFDDFKKNLDVETLAKLAVKIVIVNNSEVYYVTSTGQLSPVTPEGYQAALNLELSFWNQNLDESKEKIKEEK